MQTKILSFLSLFFTIFLSSCGAQKVDTYATETAIVNNIFATWTAAAALVTPLPSNTPIPEIIGTPTPWQTPTPMPVAIVKSAGLNLREGPGTDFLSIELLTTSNTLLVIGQSGICNWLKVIAPSGRKGWVSGGDYYVSLNAPCEQIPEAAYQPINGTRLIDYRTYAGAGILKLTNPLVSDAVIILTNMSRYPVLAIYIRAGETYTIEGIPESTYEVYLAVGNGWLGDEMVFEEDLGKYSVLDLYNVTTANSEYSLMISTESGEAAPVESDEFPSLTQ